MKTYTITLTDELDADIQYLIETGNTDFLQRYPSQPQPFLFNEYLQSVIDNHFTNISYFVGQAKDRELLNTVKSDPSILMSVNNKIQLSKTNLVEKI